MLGAGGGQVLADVVGTNRQLAVAAVDEHRQLHALRAAVGEQRLDRGAHGAPGEQHVVDDHHRQPGDVEVDVRGVQHWRVGTRGDVVAVEADVEVAERHVRAEQLLQYSVQPLREERAAAVDADERGYRTVGVALEDLVRDARERPPYFVLVQDDLLIGCHRFLPGLTGPG